MLKKITTKRDSTIKKAIEILNKYIEIKIVLVIDQKSRLVGTITDGDVRRGLLRGLNVHDSVERIMHKNFKFLVENNISNDQIQKLKKLKINQIPILNKKKNVLRILKLDQINSETKKDIIIFIMAGGYGKRLRPLTNKMPKPLVTIGSKPIIKILIENFIKSGFVNFYVSVFFKSEEIKKTLGEGEEKYSIRYIEEDTPLGTAGSLAEIQKINKKGPIIVINADIITSINFNELLNYHKTNNADITVCVRQYTMNIPFGVVESKNKKIKTIDEKPNKNFLVNAGIYVFEKDVIKKIKKKQIIDMPDLINSFTKKKKVFSFPIFEDWHDIGEMKELIEVRKLYSKKK